MTTDQQDSLLLESIPQASTAPLTRVRSRHGRPGRVDQRRWAALGCLRVRQVAEAAS